MGDWPDEREYARSERSGIGSGSIFTSSLIGASSQMYEEEQEDDLVRYEVGIENTNLR